MARQADAAPHCPAGHFSPYRDGEKTPSSPVSPIANLQEGRRHCGQLLSPRLRGEMPGRAMRGGADIDMRDRVDHILQTT
ncbi:MAG: hypothetical protein E5X51_00030 [Mesorhizobium sp.]|nr:MAG: hypothetical protein E5X51_00030 [Mesorhizobium sp.]